MSLSKTLKKIHFDKLNVTIITKLTIKIITLNGLLIFRNFL